MLIQNGISSIGSMILRSREFFLGEKHCSFKKGFADAPTVAKRKKLVKQALKDIKSKLKKGYNSVIKQLLNPALYCSKQEPVITPDEVQRYSKWFHKRAGELPSQTL
ncbi:hypothetical protein PV783_28240 [Chitinophaga sp. CC14]|uniref:hypothetical protein n=1 Tax=Chitinophaga sp. CC14 TaxID=3029199 RepID=UPI003B821D38